MIGFRMWAQAVAQAGTTDVNAVRQAMYRQRIKAPSGFEEVMNTNHHLSKPVMIGKIGASGTFDVIWQSINPVRADAWSKYIPDSAKRTADWTFPWVCGGCTERCLPSATHVTTSVRGARYSGMPASRSPRNSRSTSSFRPSPTTLPRLDKRMCGCNCKRSAVMLRASSIRPARALAAAAVRNAPASPGLCANALTAHDAASSYLSRLRRATAIPRSVMKFWGSSGFRRNERAKKLIKRGLVFPEQHAGPSARLPSERQVLIDRKAAVDQCHTCFVVTADKSQGVARRAERGSIASSPSRETVRCRRLVSALLPLRVDGPAPALASAVGEQRPTSP